jgi:phosphatidylglycerol:prolipoprotein diacylglycerol transferase
MSDHAIVVPYIDPVLIQLGPLAIRWYALAYIFGLLGGWYYARRLVGNGRLWAIQPGTPVQLDDLLVWVTLGVVIGGRLGQVLLYDPSYYFANPWEIPQVWHGGMAFHGGLIGAAVAVILFAWSSRIPVLSYLDIASAVAPIGLFLGRIANFINDELWGRAARGVSWAMISPSSPLAADGTAIPRYPSQLLEAGLEGLALFIILFIMTRMGALKRPGLIAGMFGLGYAAARSFCELYREPDGLVFGGPLTIGQAYSIPMVAIGIGLVAYAMIRRPKAA